MLSFSDAASVAASPDAVSDPRLYRLLVDAVAHWTAVGVLDMTHLLIVEPGDTEAAIVEEVGFSPLVNPLDGQRFGSAPFSPFWDDLRDRGGWFELVVCVGDTGFAYALFIADRSGTDPQLLSLCRAFAE